MADSWGRGVLFNDSCMLNKNLIYTEEKRKGKKRRHNRCVKIVKLLTKAITRGSNELLTKVSEIEIKYFFIMHFNWRLGDRFLLEHTNTQEPQTHKRTYVRMYLMLTYVPDRKASLSLMGMITSSKCQFRLRIRSEYTNKETVFKKNKWKFKN